MGRIAVVVDRYPCLSESFVRRDLASLESHGFTVAVVVLSPADRCDTWLASELRATVFPAEDRASGPGWRRHARLGLDTLRDYRTARALFPAGPRGAVSAGRAVWMSGAIHPLLAGWRPDWVHAQFLGVPAAVACLLTDRLCVPLSISAHARDVFVPVVRLAGVCARARFVAACSEHARASLIGHLPAALAPRIVTLPHDIPVGPAVAERVVTDHAPLRLLSVCRLVPKKGIDVVLRALALLPPDLPYRYRIVGDGPELPRLRTLARELGLQGVELVGAVSPDVVATELAGADVFVLGTRTMQDGDRDGIPNAMLEAMAAGVPVVASDGGAVSEVIKHRRTGWLPPPNQAGAFAEALREAATDQVLRRRVAANAHAEVLRRFSSDRRSELLALRLAAELPTPASGSFQRQA